MAPIDDFSTRAALIASAAAADITTFAADSQPDRPSLARCLTFLLRHGGPARGIAIDARGWCDLRDVVRALRSTSHRFRSVTSRAIAALVRDQEVERLEVRGGMIRALYGHTLVGVAAAVTARPPLRLFHGTGAGLERSIREGGLRGMGRGFVHLTSDLGYAVHVARGVGSEWVVLRVRSDAAALAGMTFLTTAGHVWLAAHVPPEFIDPLDVARG